MTRSLNTNNLKDFNLFRQQPRFMDTIMISLSVFSIRFATRTPRYTPVFE